MAGGSPTRSSKKAISRISGSRAWVRPGAVEHADPEAEPFQGEGEIAGIGRNPRPLVQGEVVTVDEEPGRRPLCAPLHAIDPALGFPRIAISPGHPSVAYSHARYAIRGR